MSVAHETVGGPGLDKQDVVGELGERVLLLPSLVNRGLEANDRAKYLLTLLQAARAHADEPAGAFSSLRDERLAAGIADVELDDVVARSRRVEQDLYVIPGVRDLHDASGAAVSRDAGAADRCGGGSARPGAPRRPSSEPLRTSPRTVLPVATSSASTSADRAQGDSFHLLIMDAHRALNRLQAEVATETLDGASVYHLQEGDRPLVAAFMAGLHATAPLKFDHPGLGTTATRAGRRLLIQNDIGETDAHVVVITVEDLGGHGHLHRRASPAAQVLRGDARPLPSAMVGRTSAAGGAALGEHHLVTGPHAWPPTDAFVCSLPPAPRLAVGVPHRLEPCPQAPGRPGRQEGGGRPACAGRPTQTVDTWPSSQLGGERLIYDAVELAAKVPARYGEPLRDVLGPAATLEVVRFALRATSEGLRDGKSQQLIRDELRVELLRHVQAAHARLLDAAAEHASLIVETAQALRAALLRLGTVEGDAFLQPGLQASRGLGASGRRDPQLGASRSAPRRRCRRIGRSAHYQRRRHRRPRRGAVPAHPAARRGNFGGAASPRRLGRA